MESILALALGLVYTLLSLMPSIYQRNNLEAMLALFLEAHGHPLPEHCKTKSASALSRFLNVYDWSTRSVIRTGVGAYYTGDIVRVPKGAASSPH